MKEKIVVPSESPGGLDSMAAEHFGRCPCFTVLDTEDKVITETKVEENPYYHKHIPFAVPDFIATLKADTLITTGIGPRAVQRFEEHGIKVVTGASGTVKEIVEAYFGGKLYENNKCAHEKGGVKE